MIIIAVTYLIHFCLESAVNGGALVPKMAAIYNTLVCVTFTIFSIVCLISLSQGAKLSDPKILLPYHSTVVTNFTLHINISKEESHVHDSCYTWFVYRLVIARL